MNWVLVLLIMWGGQVQTTQVTFDTQPLCEAGLRKAVIELQLDRTNPDHPSGMTRVAPEITATCLQAGLSE